MEASAKVKQLLDELAAVLAEMGALQEKGEVEDTEASEDSVEENGKPEGHEDAEYTEEEDEEQTEKKIRCLCERAEKIRDKIKFYENVAAKELELRTVLDKATPASVAAVSPTQAKEGRSVTQIYHNLPGAGRLRGFKGPNAEERAYRAGMFYKSQLFGDKDASRWCVDHGVIDSRAMGEGVNSLGGVFVNDEILNEVIVLVEEYGVFAKNARNVNMNSDTLIIPRRTGGLTAYFVGENTAIQDSDAAWDRVQLVAKKIAVSNRISSELLEDSVLSLGDYLTTETARALAITSDRVGFVGNGTADDGGIVGVSTKINDGTGRASLVTASANAVTSFVIDDFVNAVARLPVYARAKASWYCNPAVFAASVQRLGLTATGGRLGAGNTAASLADGPEMRLLGFPVQFCHLMPSTLTTSTNTVMFLLGDLSLSSIYGTRRGLQVKTSTDRYAELDQTLIVSSMRMDCVTHSVGTSTQAGPVVALRTATT